MDVWMQDVVGSVFNLLFHSIQAHTFVSGQFLKEKKKTNLTP